MKSDFLARPVNLSREDRIKAHFMTCFISLLIYRILEKKLNYKYTTTEILKTIRNMNVLEHKGCGYEPEYERTELTDELHEIFNFYTDYEIINYDKDNTYVYVNLHTGRYNQIRVSFAYINHPLVNDYKYGKCNVNNDDLGLWCYKIIIRHPITKEKMEFKCKPNGLIWNELKLNKK